MNNFSTPNADAKSKVPKHLESLTTTAFQSLFPPINPTTTPLKSIRRVLLLNREPSGDDDGSFILNFRHYAITTKRLGLAKPLRRLDAAAKLLHGGSGGGSSSSTRKNGRKGGGLPNLAKLQDIADYMLGGEDGEGYATDGGTSGSEMDTDAEIEVLDTAPRKVLSVKARAALAASKAAAEQDKQDGEEGEEEEHDEDDEGATERRPRSAKAHYAPERDENVERRGVRLVELGPRMRLRMLKVEEGMCSGKVLWHEYLHKSPQEVKALEQKWEQRRRDKEARKKQQKENVEKKRRAKEETKKAAKGAKDGEGDVDMEDAQSDDYDDYEDVFDSEGLEGDAEEQANARMEEWGGVGG